jgi:hypothetical protein
VEEWVVVVGKAPAAVAPVAAEQVEADLRVVAAEAAVSAAVAPVVPGVEWEAAARAAGLVARAAAAARRADRVVADPRADQVAADRPAVRVEREAARAASTFT